MNRSIAAQGLMLRNVHLDESLTFFASLILFRSDDLAQTSVSISYT